MVLEDDGGVDVIPARVDRIGFLDVPYESVKVPHLPSPSQTSTYDRG